MAAIALVLVLVVYSGIAEAQELLQNGGFESQNHWDCWNIQCSVTSDRHGGQHAVLASGRQHYYEGPSQYVSMAPGHSYQVSGWAKIQNDHGTGQKVELLVDFTFNDDTHDYRLAGSRNNVHTSDGWVHITGAVTAPDTAFKSARFYFQGPNPGVNFISDDASVTGAGGSGGHSTSTHVSSGIDGLRKSDINIQVTTAAGINKADVQIRVFQTKKSFPFGTAVNRWRYLDSSLQGYRDFIHRHFNWAVPENALKWNELEPHRGQKNFQPALDMINGLRSHGIKVRGHNLVWSVDQFVMDWVKQLWGDELRNTVRQHIEETMQRTRGLLEHWDVNNENLHGRWFQDRLNDNDYDIELFREAHNADSSMKLFLNDYNVVANWGSTNDYLQQANRIKAANVGLYGLGAQCHFGNEEYPDPGQIKARLDVLARSGLPIWITELDVQASDENKRADFYEEALTAFYEHPAVEGILFWGFWDQQHWRGEKAALVRGNNFQLTAAGRRVLDLFENRWMTDETHTLSSAGDHFTVRGFHGDYQVKVIYQGRELSQLTKTFHLGKNPHTVSVNVHV